MKAVNFSPDSLLTYISDWKSIQKNREKTFDIYHEDFSNLVIEKMQFSEILSTGTKNLSSLRCYLRIKWINIKTTKLVIIKIMSA